PVIAEQLQIRLNAPNNVNPGEHFVYEIQVVNPTEINAESVEVKLPVPQNLTIDAVQNNDVYIEKPFAVWKISQLEGKESINLELAVTAPWSYTELFTHSCTALAANMPIAAVGGPVITRVADGSVPIATAKQLLDVEVVVEGTATMYTDGFYAGSSGTKFYLQDESGGLQVYIPGGKGKVNVPIGAQVRVQGQIELYRGALELIPSSPDKVEVITKISETPAPLMVSISEALHSDTLAGSLVTIQGNAARLEEFSYSFEMDLLDEDGQLIIAYIDKETNATIETIETDHLYNVTGLLEIRDGQIQINPRLQSDLQEIPPETVMVEIEAPSNVGQNESVEIAFTLTNNTPVDIEGLRFNLPVSNQDYEIVHLSDNGQILENELVWQIPALPPGTSKSISISAKITSNLPYFEIKDYALTAKNWPEPVTGIPHYIFTSPSMPIWAIQGPDFRSPYLLKIVQTEGVVSAIFPDLGGFWMQGTKSDNDSRTSEGIFVLSEDLDLDISAGDLVEVKGLVREAYQQTRLVPTSINDVHVLSTNNQLPKPVSLAPPQDEDEAKVYYETMEGMLVEVPGSAVAVSPINKYGELSIVLANQNISRLFQGHENGNKIMLDDGSNQTHTEQSTLPFVVNTGDILSNAKGPLAFSYGNYKIELTSLPRISHQPVTLPTIPESQSNQFSVMTWNVENLFDYLEPHPSSPPLPTLRQYKLDIARTANTIIAAGAPVVVAMQEVENIKVLSDIAETDFLLPYEYEPILIEGSDSRGIDVGYLVRSDLAQILDTQQFDAPEGITSRPPLDIFIEIIAADPPVSLHIINNHFTSMSGGEKATEPRRNSQAAWNKTIIDEISKDDPESNIIVLGDLNSYFDSPPIAILRSVGLQHVFDLLPENERYTYIYEGISQVLDHVLVTQWLYEAIDAVRILHINADYSLPLAGDESPVRKSDHDPVIVIFNLPE
ncbi:MAG: DUF11 domain-containing protein, partial [Anaerolineaceae bacterium]|nr:DUF11 domain-containing protein [Anaerolineaceae bacterium]